MKKAVLPIIIFLLFIGITILFIFVPPAAIINKLPFINKLTNNATLIVNTINSKANIKINEKDYGTTNQKISDLSEGIYSIKLDRITDSSNVFYDSATFTVELTNNTEAIINIEIGPDNIISGYLLYYTKAPKSLDDNGYITVTADKKDASISIESQQSEALPIQGKKLSSGEYNIVISKDGYESVEFPVIVRKDLNLNINAYLFPIPWTE
ncbi:MAG TPA: PEGA domain-containing protein [Candidatus Dojkabacteria bacterium]|nr:PEGA domain-containing protein [Candidatus Dojkabacteria bacterium]